MTVVVVASSAEAATADLPVKPVQIVVVTRDVSVVYFPSPEGIVVIFVWRFEKGALVVVGSVGVVIAILKTFHLVVVIVSLKDAAVGIGFAVSAADAAVVADTAVVASAVNKGHTPHSHYLANCRVLELGSSWFEYLPFLFPLI